MVEWRLVLDGDAVRTAARDALWDAADAVAAAAHHPLGLDVEAIAVLKLLTDVADEMLHEVVEGARMDGTLWKEIADELGVTVQAAHKRFRERAPRRLT